MLKEANFNGESGRLEGKYYENKNKNAPAALVLSPHPLHGGTMNTKVVYNAFYAFVNSNFSVLRFNFRGVGKSLGQFSDGIGELIDAATALDWLQWKNPEASSYWIAGFSFGAWIALQLLMRRPEIDGFIAIAPPASSQDFNFISPCPKPGLIIQGDRDEIAKKEDSEKLYQKLIQQKNSNIHYELIHGADHFFTEDMDKLKSYIEEFVKPRTVRVAQPKKVRRERKRKSAESSEN